MSKPRVLITDNINPQAADILKDGCEVIYEQKLSADALLSKIPEVDALMIRSASKVTADVLGQAPRLKIVGRAGVGTDNIDLEAATQRGVVVVNSPEGNTIAASEHTIGMLMAMARHISQADASMKQGDWARGKLVGVEVFGKTLGLIGMGRIGGRVAKVAQSLGMKVNVFDPFLTGAMAEDLGVTLVSLDDIWRTADFITVHAPKTKETTGLINADTLSRCKPGVRLINCARGGIISEADLVAALESGHVAGAALDVFESEPLSEDSPLRKLNGRVVLTPHLGASTEEAQVNVAIDVAEQIRDFFAYGYAKAAVNIPLLRKEILDPVKDYMPLAEVLGSLARQLVDGPVEAVEVVTRGTLYHERTEPLTLAVLKGLLANTREGVNYVNAQSIAEERGIQVKETDMKSAGSYVNLLEVIVTTRERTMKVAGTLIAEGNFRIVELDGYRLSLEPTDHILITPHHDRPGMIARVATILGESGVNISALEVGRREQGVAGGESIMVFNMDSPPAEAQLDIIRKTDGIYGISLIRL